MKKWILVEDEPDLYEILSHIYDGLGVEAHAFATGEDAMAWLDTVPVNASVPHAAAALPIFALIDIRLPGKLDGVEVAQHFREHPLLHAMPIVLMTAYRISPQQERDIMARSGANILVYKPLPDFPALRRIFVDLTGQIPD